MRILLTAIGRRQNYICKAAKSDWANETFVLFVNVNKWPKTLVTNVLKASSTSVSLNDLASSAGNSSLASIPASNSPSLLKNGKPPKMDEKSLSMDEMMLFTSL